MNDLTLRDRAVLAAVARFRQLTAAQIAALLFSGLSAAPSNRSLRRLVERGYLVRIERRLTGGAKGGSGQYVYSLGKLGWQVHRVGRYKPARSVYHHTIAIADTYLVLREKHLQQKIHIEGFSTEPDCHVQVGNIMLKPDLYLDMKRPDGQVKRYWFEIDMGTEGQMRIRDKLQRYWHAYQQASTDQFPLWPLVVFVAFDRDRAEELKWVIKHGPEQARPLFRVATLETLRAADL